MRDVTVVLKYEIYLCYPCVKLRTVFVSATWFIRWCLALI